MIAPISCISVSLITGSCDVKEEATQNVVAMQPKTWWRKQPIHSIKQRPLEAAALSFGLAFGAGALLGWAASPCLQKVNTARS